MKIKLARSTIPPRDGNDSCSIDYAPTAGEAKGSSVTVSRSIVSLQFGTLPSITTPNFRDMNNQEYQSTMNAAAKTVGTYGRLMGTALAKLVIPGIEDAARRFHDHRHDHTYRLTGQSNLGGYVRSLGLNPATIRKWKQRIREHEAIQNKSVPTRGVRSHDRIVTLAVEGSWIIFNQFGDRLMGSPGGNRLVQIAREILELSPKRLRNRTTANPAQMPEPTAFFIQEENVNAA